jgi:UDP-3-O-[3-hydroxymyristoyl] glucosamine N-acyltransferase
MASRVTKVGQRALTQPDAVARVTIVGQRALAQPDAIARVTLVGQRVLVTDWAVIGQRSRVSFID